MEDDNGLELRLGLSLGKSSTTPRSRNDSSSETRIEDVDRGSKIIDDFRNFLHAGTQSLIKPLIMGLYFNFFKCHNCP